MRSRALGAACLAGLVLFAVLMTFRVLPPELGRGVSYVVQSGTVLAACVLSAVRARSERGPLRRPRALFSASLLFAALGGVAAFVVGLVSAGPPPVPSVADALHFAFLPLCIAGLLSYPVRADLPGSRAQMIVDGTVATTALWFVTYAALLAPADVGPDLLTTVTILAYPASDVFVIAMAAGALHRVAPSARRELALSAAGVSLYAVSDTAYTVLSAQGRYTADSWVAVVAELGLVLLVVAVLPHRPGRERGVPWSAWAGWLPVVAVAAAFAFALARTVTADGLGGLSLALLVGLMLALVARQLVGNRDRDRALRGLRESQALFRSLVVGSSDLITLHSATGVITYASPAVSRLTGLDGDELARRTLRDLLHPQDRAAVRRLAADLRSGAGATGQLLVRVATADGSWRWCRTVATNLLDHPDVRGIVCNTRDVHEEHLLQQRLAHEAHHDALTGLGNITEARRLLEQACTDPAGRPTVAVLLDLDGFKQVNDTFGHAEGDALLVAVAERLRACTRAGDAVTRTGGDEFLLLLREGSGTTASQVARRVLDELSRPFVVHGRVLTIGASIGLAAVADGATPDDVLRNADLAMYAAKAAGRGRVVAFEPRMHEKVRRDMAISTALRGALRDGGLELHYQPIVDLTTGDVAAVEALLRWRPAGGAPVAPDEFIPVAEEVGLMPEVDAWVLDRACADLAGWRRDGVRVPQVSVNVSRRSVTADLPGLVAAALERHGLGGEELCVEVTETAVAQDPGATAAVLRSLRDLGVQVALDDFGTGQSSLSELARLPVDVVKIDRSFLRGAASADAALLTSIIDLCAALGMSTVAEGIEDVSLGQVLAAAGCRYGQGYALGRPAPAAALAARQAAPVAV